jgi:hypothetical protein
LIGGVGVGPYEKRLGTVVVIIIIMKIQRTSTHTTATTVYGILHLYHKVLWINGNVKPLFIITFVTMNM